MKNEFSKDVYNFIPLGPNRDVTVLEASYRRKHPEVSKKPMSKNYYALHLILSGSGKLETAKGVYTLKKGDIFVRFPNETIAYYDNDATPFRYIFITFQGSIVKNYLEKAEITAENRIFSTTPELTALFKNVIAACRDYPAVSDMISSGFMHLIFAEIAKKHVQLKAEKYCVQQNYVNNAIDFIDQNISNGNLSASYVAQYLNLNCDYFLRIFKNVTGLPFSGYVTAKKMNLAARLLKEENVSVSAAAEQLGYNSLTYFIKVFRKNFNQTPREFKRSVEPEDERE